MGEHYTRNTFEVTAYCPKCGRMTQHRVDGGRRGLCLEHKAQQFTKAQLTRQREAERARKNPRLFE